MKNDMTEEQFQKLQEGLQGHRLEAMLLLAMDSGIRRDELRQLTWSGVDLDTGEIQVVSSKTKRRVRRKHLSEQVVCVLKLHALRQEELNGDADRARPGLDLVFPDDAGGAVSVQQFLQEWYAFCEQVGLPRLRFHDLRVLFWRRLLAQERV